MFGIDRLKRKFKKSAQRLLPLFPHYGIPYDRNTFLLSKLKNKHKNQIGFLIGNGPSVRPEDLDKLDGRVTFCCNRFHLAYGRTRLRPMYTLSADKQMIEDFGQEIVTASVGTKLFIAERDPNLKGEYLWARNYNTDPMIFSENIYDFVMPGGGTLITAIQIGYFMGITKFVLYGVDHNLNFNYNKNEQDIFRKASGEGNHFIENYRSGKAWCPPEVRMIEESFVICDKFLRKKSGWIKNATRGGHLEVLDRIDFDSIISEDYF